LSQQNIADELNLTVASYSNIERGVTDITITRLFEIAKILDVKIDYLLDLEQNHTTPTIQALLTKQKMTLL
jgi:transcriptional regulator with XRE-family HTH domain